MEALSFGLRNRFARNESEPKIHEKIRNFEIESRYYQTLVYNFKTPLEHLDFIAYDINRFKKIQDFIKNYANQSPVDFRETKVLSLHIFRNCNEFKRKYASLLWVYFCDFQTYNTESYPVFKLYDNKNDDGPAEFIDWNGKVHLSWSNFLDNFKLPPGLICVPEDGTYKMAENSERLRLEFFSTVQLMKAELNTEISLPQFTPHIKKIDIWLKEFKEFLDSIKQKAVKKISEIWEVLKPFGKPLLILAMRVIPLGIQYKATGSIDLPALMTLARDIYYLFCHSCSEDKLSKAAKNIKDFCEGLADIREKINEGNRIEIYPLISKISKSLLLFVKEVLPYLPSNPVVTLAIKMVEFILNGCHCLTAQAEMATYEIDSIGNRVLKNESLYLQPQRDKTQCEIENLTREITVDLLKIENDEAMMNLQNKQSAYSEKSEGMAELNKQTVFFVKEPEPGKEITIASFTASSPDEETENLQKMLGADFTLSQRENYYDAFDSHGNHLGRISSTNKLATMP